jgi:hypothetical protein
MTASLLLLLLAAGPVVVPEPAAPSPAATNQRSSPVFATSGFTKAAEVRKGCVANQVRLQVDLAGVTGTVTSKFAVEPDGSVSRFEPLSDAPGGVVAAIWEAIQSCQFTPGKDPKGVPVATWMILPIRFVAEGPPPVAGTAPREAEPGCVGNQLKYRFPPNRLLHGLLGVRASISAEGKVGAVEVPPDLPDDVVNAFTLSIQGCEFQPAMTPEGKPTSGTFEYRVNFGQPGAAGRADGGGPKLKREAKLSNTLCLQRLRPFGVIGHAVVQVTVTPEGEPTNFRLQPQNLPVDLRTQIVDMLSLCKWETALDLEDRPVAGDTEVTLRYR